MDTGFYKVKRNNDSDIFNWDYILENGRKIQGRNLKDLRNKVAILGYKWEVIDSTLAEQSKSMDENNQKNNKTNISPLSNPKKNIAPKKIDRPYRTRTRVITVPKEDIVSKTGYKHVKLDRLNNEWIYDDGTNNILRKYLWKLEEDAKYRNLEWKVTDESIAHKFYEEEQEIIFSYSLPSFYKFLKENDVLNFDSTKLIEIIKDYEEKNNGTGLLFVSPIINNTGNNWRYKNFRDKSWIYASTLKELEKNVINNKLKWEIINERLFENSLAEDKSLIDKLNDEIKIQKGNTETGLFRVSFNKCWEYEYLNKLEQAFKIEKRTISQLKEEVSNLDLPWIVIDNNLAEKSEMKDKELIKKYAVELEFKRKEEENKRIEEIEKAKEVASEKPEVKRKELYKMFR